MTVKNYVNLLLEDVGVRKSEFVLFVAMLFLLAAHCGIHFFAKHGMAEKIYAYQLSRWALAGFIAVAIVLALKIVARMFVEEHWREDEETQS